MRDLNNWGRVLISAIVVLGFVGVTVIYMTRKLDGNPVPEILSILLGSLATNFTNVVGYWMGSSSGSSAKDSTLQAIASKVPPVPALLLGVFVWYVTRSYLVLA